MKGDETSRATYRVMEVAEMLGVTRVTVYRMMDDGQLPYVQVRKRLRLIPAEALQRLARAQDVRYDS